MLTSNLFSSEMERLASFEPAVRAGRVREVSGLAIRVSGISVPVGSLLEVQSSFEDRIEAEVVASFEDECMVMPFGELRGISPGNVVELISTRQSVAVSPEMLGRVLDGRGRPIDGLGKISSQENWVLYPDAPDALRRRRIAEPISTGVRAIDSLVTVGKGQRMGLFSGSGVGKSVLLGMIARYTNADIIVIALVGERGREVREFIERDLGEEGLKRSVVVVATSDQPATARVKAPFTATAIADYFRSQGKDVFLLMDSITRMAMAQREIGLSVGEPPATKGYPPSVFAIFPSLLERAGMGEKGSITAIYNVLVEADDMSEPISDTVRGILDGHIWLSRDMAHRGHYPAIDPLGSISRVMKDVVKKEHIEARTKAVKVISDYRGAEDLINIGAYAKGSNPDIDEAIRYQGKLNAFLQQDTSDYSEYNETIAKFVELMEIESEEAAK